MKTMLRPFFFVLIFLYSCGSFKSYQSGPAEEILSAVPVVGEGKGRVGIRGKNYVFAFDALFKNGRDWVFSATIPLHGEELLIFSDLQSSMASPEEDSFERRIVQMLKQEAPEIVAPEKVIFELRQMMRFMLSAKLGLKRTCDKEESEFQCKLGDSESRYTVKDLSRQRLSVTKTLSSDEAMILEGENFQNTRFMRTNFSYVIKGEKIFSLELLWSNT